MSQHPLQWHCQCFFFFYDNNAILSTDAAIEIEMLMVIQSENSKTIIPNQQSLMRNEPEEHWLPC